MATAEKKQQQNEQQPFRFKRKGFTATVTRAGERPSELRGQPLRNHEGLKHLRHMFMRREYYELYRSRTQEILMTALQNSPAARAALAEIG
jgi:hypothetical protein